MAAHIGTIDLNTRVLLAIGDGEPVEIGTIDAVMPSRATGTASGVDITLDTRRWRRHLAIGFLRVAWAIWTMRDHKA